jgi:hypothetical protein
VSGCTYCADGFGTLFALPPFSDISFNHDPKCKTYSTGGGGPR